MRRLPPIVASAVLLGLLSRTADAQTVVRGPYLQQGTPSSVVVVWRTDTATDSMVRYGTAVGALDQTVTVAGTRTQHEVTVTGLTAGTRYYYSVGNAAGPLAGGDANHTIDVAPPVGSTGGVRMWVVGDSGTGGTNQRLVRDQMLAATGSDPPDIFLHVGDMAYSDGLDSEFQQRFFEIYQDILRNTPCWPAMGNHEGHTSSATNQTGPYYDAYVLPTAGEAGGLSSGTEAYYAFDYANLHFIVLDSHETPDTPVGHAAMTGWLQDDLASTAQDWIIAYWHHPAYTHGSHNSDTEGALVTMREDFLPILEAGGVDLVLAGHSHIYERSYLLDGAYDTPTTLAGHVLDMGDGRPDGDGAYTKVGSGAVYITAGHGGTTVSQGAPDHVVMYLTEVENGSVLIDADATALVVQNIRVDGVVSDHFTLLRGPGVVLTAPRAGDAVLAGASYDVRWGASGASDDLRLDYSLDGGATWSVITASTTDTGIFTWAVPVADTTTAQVRITDNANGGLTDTTGNFTISTSIPEVVIPWGGTWKYHDQGVDQGNGWQTSDFDDGAWPSGAAQLGYGDGDETTVLYDAPGDNIPSVYFRQVLNFDRAITEASFDVIHDDGVAVWINGTLVFEKYTTNGTAYAVYSSGGSDNELSSVTLDLGSNPFVIGANVIAVMVKQSGPTSSDLSFDFEMTVRREAPVTGNTAPVLDPVGDRAGREGELISFVLMATDPDSDPLTFLGSAMPAGAVLDASTGVFSWTPAVGQAGTHDVTFSVGDGRGGTDSEAITITVIGDEGVDPNPGGVKGGCSCRDASDGRLPLALAALCIVLRRRFRRGGPRRDRPLPRAG